jgi:hypothetical protein
MQHSARIFALALALVLFGCIGVPIERQWWSTGVRPEEWAEIRAAMREYTSAPVTLCARTTDQRGEGRVMVTTEDHGDYKHYWALKVNGKWQITAIEGMVVT